MRSSANYSYCWQRFPPRAHLCCSEALHWPRSKVKWLWFQGLRTWLFSRIYGRHREKARVLAGMINYFPEHQLHWRNRDARGRRWRICLTVFRVESKFVKCFFFFFLKKQGTDMTNHSLVNTKAQDLKQCFVFDLREWHFLLGEHDTKKITEQLKIF
jgi:hypothetical protein